MIGALAKVVRAGVMAASAAALPFGGPLAHAAEGLSYPPPAPPYLGGCGAEAGGFRLPGSDGCLRISGTVAAEAAATTGGGWSLGTPAFAVARGQGGPLHPAAAGAANLSRSAFGVGTRLSADVRLPTEYGPVRVFMSLRGVDGQTSDRAAR